ncbi:quercetin 2,3-dioxygenase [Hymenobacter agri]
MISQTPGKIFLAEERGLADSEQFRRYSTFSFGGFAHPHKGPFGRLFGLNEETLAGGHTVEFTVAEATQVLLLPITGAVAASIDAEAPEALVEAGETLLLALPAGSALRLRNPFGSELVSFLHIWLRADAGAVSAAAQPVSFAFSQMENRLLPLRPGAPAELLAASLGRFAGRQEAVYQLRNPAGSVFVFVLAGAFEVESRLLHEKDGLALWDVAAIELEALSNDALLLVLELPPLAETEVIR